ncbi:hypothetical protein [Streptomyces sp. S.PB5]|uniref:hypothetical protein n=1 Tax=Streptomyces sp. S.PB5 TaxID=3020844 RepID=UPI0025B1D017|nr:hypothetical protein [Streptomyces sp. S.PB5]MDN3029686.1 hypothetical protein [Streptomyces sp. S.PB5]
MRIITEVVRNAVDHVGKGIVELTLSADEGSPDRRRAGRAWVTGFLAESPGVHAGDECISRLL